MSRHKAGEEGRAGRPEKSSRRCRQEQARVNPGDGRVLPRDQNQAEAGAGTDEQRDKDDALAAEVVRQMSRRQRAADHCDHFRKADDAEREWRVCALVQLPAHRHGQHLLAEHGGEPSDEVKPEIADAQHRVVVRWRIFSRLFGFVHQS
jgi:hypothetical protein